MWCKRAAALALGALLLVGCGGNKATTPLAGVVGGQAASVPAGVSAQSTPQEFAQARLITLSELKGKVRVESGGKTQDAYKGQRLNAGDIVRTGEKAGATLILDDEKVVTLDQNTEVSVREASGTKAASITVLFLSAGTVVNSLPKLEAQSAYAVKTSNATMGVRGTVFAVQVKNGATLLAVADGRVAAGPPELSNEELADSLLVSGMEQLRLSGDVEQMVREGAQPQPLNTNEFSVQVLSGMVKGLAEHRDQAANTQSKQELQDRIDQIVKDVPLVKQSMSTGDQTWIQPPAAQAPVQEEAGNTSKPRTGTGNGARDNSNAARGSNSASSSNSSGGSSSSSPSSSSSSSPSSSPSSSSSSSSSVPEPPEPIVLNAAFLAQFQVSANCIFYETSSLTQPAARYEIDVTDDMGRSLLPQAGKTIVPVPAGQQDGKPVYSIRFEQNFTSPLQGEYRITLKAVAQPNSGYVDSPLAQRNFRVLAAPRFQAAQTKLLPGSLEVAFDPVAGVVQYEVSLEKNGEVVLGPQTITPANAAAPVASLPFGQRIPVGEHTVKVSAVPAVGSTDVKSPAAEMAVNNSEAFDGSKQNLFLDYWNLNWSQSQISQIQAVALLPADAAVNTSDFTACTITPLPGGGSFSVKKADGSLLFSTAGAYTLYMRMPNEIVTLTENVANVSSYQHSPDMTSLVNALTMGYSSPVSLPSTTLPECAALSQVDIAVTDSVGQTWATGTLDVSASGTGVALSYTGGQNLPSGIFTATLTARAPSGAYLETTATREVDFVQIMSSVGISSATTSEILIQEPTGSYPAIQTVVALPVGEAFSMAGLVPPTPVGSGFLQLNGSYTAGASYVLYVQTILGGTKEIYKTAPFTIV